MSLADKSFSIFNLEVILTVLRIGTGAIVARTLGPVGVGMWAVLDLLTNYCRVFGGLRFEIASVYFLGQKKYDRGEVIFLTNVIAVVIGTALMLFLAANYGLLEKTLLRKISIQRGLVVIVLAHLPLLFLKRNYLYFLLSRENTRAYNILMMVDNVARTAVTLVLLLVFDYGLWSLAFGLLAGTVASLCYGVKKVHKVEELKLHINFSLLKEMFKYSYKVYFSEAAGFLTVFLSNLITAVTLSPTALAFFSMGKGKADYSYRITSAIGTIFYPRISNIKGVNGDPVSVATTSFRISLVILLIAAIVCSILIYPATILLYGREFIPLTTVFFIIVPSLVFSNSTNLQRQYFLGTGRADIPMKIAIVPLILQVGLCYLLMPSMGYIGAAVAVSISFFVTAIITVIVYKVVTAGKFKDILIPKSSDIAFIYKFFRDRLRVFLDRIKNVFRRKVICTKTPPLPALSEVEGKKGVGGIL